MGTLVCVMASKEHVVGDYSKYTCLRVDKPGEGVAEVVLARPKQLNTMTAEFFEEIGRVFRALDCDPEVNAIVLWAEGRMFTAGLDLKAAASSFNPDPSLSRSEGGIFFRKIVKQWQSDLSQIQECTKPVIAATHGRCIGGGVDLVTACDIRLCTEDATFCVAETKMAMVADIGTLQRITKIVGKGLAREMVFTSDDINAQRAHRFGLVNEVYKDKDELLAKARAMAKRIASHSAMVVQGAKIVLNYSDEHTVAEGLEYVGLWNGNFMQSDDLTEAMMSFMEKRPPKFKNRL